MTKGSVLKINTKKQLKQSKKAREKAKKQRKKEKSRAKQKRDQRKAKEKAKKAKEREKKKREKERKEKAKLRKNKKKVIRLTNQAIRKAEKNYKEAHNIAMKYGQSTMADAYKRDPEEFNKIGSPINDMVNMFDYYSDSLYDILNQLQNDGDTLLESVCKRMMRIAGINEAEANEADAMADVYRLNELRKEVEKREESHFTNRMTTIYEEMLAMYLK